MNEFLEGYLDKPLKMDILSQEYEGQLISPDGEKVMFQEISGSELISFQELIRSLVNQRVQVVFSRLLDEEKGRIISLRVSIQSLPRNLRFEIHLIS